MQLARYCCSVRHESRRSPTNCGEGGRVTFVRHRWARRYILRVLDDGTLRVTLPRRGSKREAQAFVEQQRSVDRKAARTAGAQSRLAVVATSDEPALRKRAHKELPPALLALARAHDITVTRISVRNQRSRWGACSARGSITLNWRLILVPDFVREYVMIHELMHRRELNHSSRFWRHVAAACPRPRSRAPLAADRRAAAIQRWRIVLMSVPRVSFLVVAIADRARVHGIGTKHPHGHVPRLSDGPSRHGRGRRGLGSAAHAWRVGRRARTGWVGRRARLRPRLRRASRSAGARRHHLHGERRVGQTHRPHPALRLDRRRASCRSMAAMPRAAGSPRPTISGSATGAGVFALLNDSVGMRGDVALPVFRRRSSGSGPAGEIRLLAHFDRRHVYLDDCSVT